MRKLAPIALFVAALACGARAAEYHQAPELDAAVAAGKLPPVAGRVGDKPEVVKPSTIGRYGGVLRSALRGDADHNAILRVVGNMGLTRWSPDYESVVPNVAESWSANADASEYTFKLRAGMKWSDGQNFTADDILFFTNDLLNDPQFFDSPPSQYVINGKPMRAEKIDDATVKFIFAGPYLGFPAVLASPLGQHPVLYAKHYCQRFDPKFNPDVGKLLAEARQPDWATLFRQRCGDIEIPARWANPERPVLDPWVIQTPYTGGGTQVVLTRNPYFWQVDPQGNQLPYIGTMNLKVISDIQSIVLASLGGQLDFMVRHINTINNKPVLSEHADAGGYVLQPLASTEAAASVLFLNQTDKNPKLRELFRNKDFRIALSHALDREEINDIVYLGQSKPWQTGPAEADKFYNAQLAHQFTEHDPEKANAMLDKLGLAKRDSNGKRLLPDGSKLFMTIDVMVTEPASVDVAELVRKQLAEVDIDMGINTMERSLFYDRAQNNDQDIDVMPIPGGLNPTADPRGWLSTHTLDSRQSIPWVRWYASGGRSGEAPTPSMQERLKLWDQWKQAGSTAQADDLFRQILQKAADAYEVIGIVQGLTTFGMHSKKLMNVPASMPNSWDYPTPAPTLPQQYFFAN